MRRVSFILLFIILIVPVFIFSQTSFGPIIGYELASVRLVEISQPFGNPETKGFDNGSFLVGARISKNLNYKNLMSANVLFTKKEIGKADVWANTLTYNSIQNSLIFERKISEHFSFGTGIIYQFNTGFNFKLTDKCKNENHLGATVLSSYQLKKFIFEIKYCLLWNINQMPNQYLKSCKSIEFTSGYMFKL